MAVSVGSVFVRRVKKPNLEVFEGLGAGAGRGTVLVRRLSRSFWMSGVAPRVGLRVTGGNAVDGLGEGRREDGLNGRPDLLLVDAAAAAAVAPNFESVELVRLWGAGKFIILLCMTGEGPRSPIISGVPSLLGLDGRLEAGRVTGDSLAR